jgi:ornithine decarboxylase
VVLIAKRSPEDEVRWVYLDIGKFHGLAETIGESIRYPIRTTHDRDETAPCIIAGPTCDSVDVLYEKTPYPLPVSLAIGDKVLDRGCRRLHRDLFVGRLQRLPAAAAICDLSIRRGR